MCNHKEFISKNHYNLRKWATVIHGPLKQQLACLILIHTLYTNKIKSLYYNITTCTASCIFHKFAHADKTEMLRHAIEPYWVFNTNNDGTASLFYLQCVNFFTCRWLNMFDHHYGNPYYTTDNLLVWSDWQKRKQMFTTCTALNII